MATFLFKGMKERGGIPRHAKVRVESLPKRHCVFNGRVTNSVALELDPGKYVFKIRDHSTKGASLSYGGSFLWGLSEEEYRKIKDLRPKSMKVMNTSEGVRYLCQYTGCDDEFTSRTGAVIHETEHQGSPIITPQDKNFLNPVFETAESVQVKKDAAKLHEKVISKARLMEEQKLIQEQLDRMGAEEKAGQALKQVRTAQRVDTAE